MPFGLMDKNPEWPEIYSDINNHYDLSQLNHGDSFTMDEALLVIIDHKYTRVYWHFATSFSDCIKVNVIFVPRDYSFAKVYSARIIKDDGSIMLSLGTLPVGQYYMIVYGKR